MEKSLNFNNLVEEVIWIMAVYIAKYVVKYSRDAENRYILSSFLCNLTCREMYYFCVLFWDKKIQSLTSKRQMFRLIDLNALCKSFLRRDGDFGINRFLKIESFSKTGLLYGRIASYGLTVHACHFSLCAVFIYWSAN